MKAVNIDTIRIDGDTQGRVVIDQSVVYEYVEAMKDGSEFPPMDTVFDGATYWLVDGFHRYQAYKIIGVKEVDVSYRVGTLEDAQVLSFGANGTHGKPRTNADKVKVVEMALKHRLTKDKSDYELAKICAVSRPFVASVRSPEAKKRQQDNRKSHVEKKAREIQEERANSNPITSERGAGDDISAGVGPDDEEIRALQAAHDADMQNQLKKLRSVTK